MILLAGALLCLAGATLELGSLNLTFLTGTWNFGLRVFAGSRIFSGYTLYWKSALPFQ
jgi:hypothetical protein